MPSMSDKYQTLYTAINEYASILSGPEARAACYRALFPHSADDYIWNIPLSTVASMYRNERNSNSHYVICVLSVVIGNREEPIYVQPIPYPLNLIIDLSPSIYTFTTFVIPSLHSVLPAM